MLVVKNEKANSGSFKHMNMASNTQLLENWGKKTRQIPLHKTADVTDKHAIKVAKTAYCKSCS